MLHLILAYKIVALHSQSVLQPIYKEKEAIQIV